MSNGGGRNESRLHDDGGGDDGGGDGDVTTWMGWRDGDRGSCRWDK